MDAMTALAWLTFAAVIIATAGTVATARNRHDRRWWR